MKPDELKQWRTEHGYSRAVLALMLGVSTSALVKWEAGTRPVPSLMVLALRALDGSPVTTEELYDYLSPRPKRTFPFRAVVRMQQGTGITSIDQVMGAIDTSADTVVLNLGQEDRHDA